MIFFTRQVRNMFNKKGRKVLPNQKYINIWKKSLNAMKKDPSKK